MFNLDPWQEILETLNKNKLRTFLTGLSVASGIFILVILLGFGQGMQNGIKKEFSGDATNLIYIWSQTTTKEYKGLNPGRRIRMENANYNHVISAFGENIEYKSRNVRVRLESGTINYKQESGSYGIQGIDPDWQQIENAKLTSGRFINYSDLETINKVVVISSKIHREMMKSVKDPLNEYLQLSGINFKIIGVFTDEGGDREENRIYIPITTAQRVFNGGERIDNMAFTIITQKNLTQSLFVSTRTSEEIKQYLQQVHKVAPDDPSAIRVHNRLDEVKKFTTLTDSMAMFFWFVGICTIIAGVVGVSNVMLIVVKERTKEIGIRKALGAKPFSIIAMILHEAVFITAIAGFAGLIFSMGLLEIVGPNVEVDYVVNPSVNLNIALTMVIILIIAGSLAGFFPAWRAARIKPIIALRDE